SNMMDLITYYEERFPRLGETIVGKDFEIGFGGKGANQAVAVARLGGEVILLTAVGDDLFGPLVQENFALQGIDTRYVKVVPGKTSGVAPIFVNPRGENSIFIIPGANLFLEPEDVEKARQDLARASFFLLQLEIKLETVYYAISLAQEIGCRVILNPAPAQKLDFEKLKGVFLFVPNETELQNLLNLPSCGEREIREGIAILLQEGIENVLVTLGARGAVLGNRQGFFSFPPYEVTPVDTTGAGDAFLGSLAFFLSQEYPLEEAIDRASAYAALSTTRRGTQKSFPFREEFVEWLKVARKKTR
ncbi:MAG: ribokinase, partial [Candidatus Caldatribacteriaceae bacterium]